MMTDDKYASMLPKDFDSTELISKRILQFVDKTADELELSEADVTIGSLVTLLLHYLKNRSDDKSEATAHLMSLITSVLLITSANTTWVNVADMPDEKDKN